MTYILEENIEDAKEKERVAEVLKAINSKNRSKFWKVKRAIDLIIATFGIIIFFIPMLIIALVVFLEDRHNPFYSQDRVGRFGKTFKMYKFRTMIPDADKMLEQFMEFNEMDGPVFKIKDDKRITKVGKFLRKTSLDELPQFFNVLKGDMTIIGPRPPLPNEVAQYTEYHKIRLLVTPGLTCIWQASPNRNSISFEDWVDMDIDYVLHRTLLLDIKIILMTVRAMVCGEGQ